RRERVFAGDVDPPRLPLDQAFPHKLVDLPSWDSARFQIGRAHNPKPSDDLEDLLFWKGRHNERSIQNVGGSAQPPTFCSHLPLPTPTAAPPPAPPPWPAGPAASWPAGPR